MKKILLLGIIVGLIIPFVSLAQTDNIKLGRIYFSKPFVHSQKNYARGTYKIELVKKDAKYFFNVMNKKGEQLFEELAVIKPFEGKNKKFKYRVKKEFLKNFEYFRIKVTTPKNLIMAYFLVKK
jgi:hypothetical protein